jgi:hypothetical protein
MCTERQARWILVEAQAFRHGHARRFEFVPDRATKAVSDACNEILGGVNAGDINDDSSDE